MSDTDYRVFYWDTHPKKKNKRKRVFIGDRFTSRQTARVFCRNNSAMCPIILHPDGTEENYHRSLMTAS